MTLGLSYLRAIELAGGLPVVLPPLGADAIPALLERLDGVCLSGGPDLHPGGYQHDPHPELGPGVAVAGRLRDRARPRRRRARAAGPRHLPRRAGAQRRARRDAAPAPPRRHRRHASSTARPRPARRSTHEVVLEPGSAVARVLGGEVAAVNSFHHQAVDALGARAASRSATRRTASSRRSRPRTARTSAACSGTRRRSWTARPTWRSSRASSTRRRAMTVSALPAWAHWNDGGRDARSRSASRRR